MSDAAESSDIIEIALEGAFPSRPVNTQIFEAFLIGRLMEHPAMMENSLTYQALLQDVGDSGMRLVTVKWTWTDAVVPSLPLAAQQEAVTEAAAVGLAFVTLANFTPALLFSTADRGERFDYVLAENGVLCGVEISGTQSEDRQAMRDRQRQKIRQLLANPKRWGGYVVIVGFTRREIWISRHAPEEIAR